MCLSMSSTLGGETATWVGVAHPPGRAARHRMRRGTTDRCWTSPAPASHAGAVPTSPGSQPPRGVLAVLCVAQFVLILDVAVVNVALVPLAGDLGVAADGLQVVASAYAACFGGVLLLGGRLADGGRRRTTITAASRVRGARSSR